MTHYPIDPSDYLETECDVMYDDDIIGKLFYWKGRLVRVCRRQGGMKQVVIADAVTHEVLAYPSVTSLHRSVRKEKYEGVVTTSGVALNLKNKIATASRILSTMSHDHVRNIDMDGVDKLLDDLIKLLNVAVDKNAAMMVLAPLLDEEEEFISSKNHILENIRAPAEE